MSVPVSLTNLLRQLGSCYSDDIDSVGCHVF